MNKLEDFKGIKAIFVNCSIKPNKKESHTQLLIDKVAGIMESQAVEVEQIFLNDFDIAFGMVKDGAEQGNKDDWPSIQAKIMEADILVLGSPIWLGVKSSLATLAIERMYAYSGDRNDKDQYLYYGKTGGCIITGNEDEDAGRAIMWESPLSRERAREVVVTILCPGKIVIFSEGTGSASLKMY